MKEVTYDFPAGGATLETIAKNVAMQFGVGNSQDCHPSPQGISQCSQWQLEDGSYMRLGVDAYQRNITGCRRLSWYGTNGLPCTFGVWTSAGLLH